jgi:ubiquinone/menaquinone biosynthesis C-methylase UbiE
MSVTRNILMRAFGRPQGMLGRLGGIIMARINTEFGGWVSDLLEVRLSESVLEVGFGPGTVIHHLAALAAAGQVAGIDPSPEMVHQARARNATAVRSGRVDLRHGSVESLPFRDNSFDKAMAVNSMQVWPNAVAGLQEIRRILKPGGKIALGFTHHSGQPDKGLETALAAAGFTGVHIVEADKGSAYWQLSRKCDP